jgi:ribosomal protein S18 acetylase RimI-like enzyme
VTAAEIVPAEVVHLPDITRLYIHLRDHHRELAPDNQRYRVEDAGWHEYARKKFDDPRAHLFVAIVNGEVVGFAGTALVDKPWGLSYEIQTMIVEEKHRDGGIGAALLDHVEAHAAEIGADGIRVDVLLQNSEARRFYESAGYEATSVRHAKPVRKN